jgi:hypothetical protein
MEDNELQQKWPELKKKLLELYPDLTEQELAVEIGKEKELLLHLQNRMGEHWKDIKNLLSIMG